MLKTLMLLSLFVSFIVGFVVEVNFSERKKDKLNLYELMAFVGFFAMCTWGVFDDYNADGFVIYLYIAGFLTGIMMFGFYMGMGIVSGYRNLTTKPLSETNQRFERINKARMDEHLRKQEEELGLLNDERLERIRRAEEEKELQEREEKLGLSHYSRRQRIKEAEEDRELREKERQLGLIDEEPEPEPEPEKPVLTFTHRNEHMLILGGTGHGKTQLLSYLIAQDLYQPVSAIVFDSQGDLVHKIVKADIPRDRIVLIDPTDIEYPIALGLFDFDTKSGTPFEQERRLNSVIELLTFVMDSLLESELTSKQEVVLRYVIRLCLTIPNANIHTLRRILSNQEEYDTSVLSLTAQEFFKTQYNSRQYNETREQILRRVYTLLENQSLERIFSATKTKLNLKKEMNEGKVILVNTAKSFLKEEGSAFFSRFIVALIAQAVQEREARDNMPVHVYIDEASPIIDKTITNLLETARKYNVGIHLAFQSLSQIPQDVEQSIIANTTTKCVGGVSARDARALQADMKTTAEQIMAMRKLHFMVSTKGWSTWEYDIPAGELDKVTKRSDLSELIAENRAKYCIHETERKEIINVSPEDIEDVFDS